MDQECAALNGGKGEARVETRRWGLQESNEGGNRREPQNKSPTPSPCGSKSENPIAQGPAVTIGTIF